jgi:glucokinase
VIAPGTGLGEAFLITGAEGVEAFPSEGGNADFAPSDDTQMELLRFMRERVGHVRAEHVCSGIGIANLYRFLKETDAAAEPAWLAERLAGVADPAPVLGEAALHAASGGESAPIATRTLELFVDILGAEAGNLALRMLPAGGVYVGGGIPPRILPLLRDGRFLRAFRAKGVFSAMMATFPVCVILDPRAAVLGAAAYASARAAAEAVAATPRLTMSAPHQP